MAGQENKSMNEDVFLIEHGGFSACHVGLPEGQYGSQDPNGPNVLGFRPYTQLLGGRVF